MKTVIAGALGECVHVAGVNNFLRMAEQAGWRTVFLGPAVSIDEFIQATRRENASLVGVSYRLTPDNGERLLAEFAESADDLHSDGVRFALGGTPPVVERARSIGFFDAYFDGTETPDKVLAYLKGDPGQPPTKEDFPQSTIDRIRWKSPYPIIRHHFGLPDFEATRQGISAIADSGVLDVISLGIDQEAQENFFHPERQDPRRRGAGGVPVRTPQDYRALFQATRRGNFPLLRTYTGTDDFIPLAHMYLDTIQIAWGAVPIFWFNQMDGRGPWDLEGSIRKHQELMTWYAQRHVPVEVNESHHWGLRDAPDVIFVVAAYLSAYNARACGVQDYIAQMMFNSPPGHTDAMDLAKMLTILKLIEPLSGPDFRIWRQTRTGLLSYPVEPDAARAHLAASVYLQMALRPHILHVVSFSEAHHAATTADVTASCKLARRAVQNAMGAADMTQDHRIQQRVQHLTREAIITLDSIARLAPPGTPDPLSSPDTLAQAIRSGILDAPQLKGNPFARGQIATRIDKTGACIAIDPLTARPLSEKERIARLELPLPPSVHHRRST